MTVRIMGIVLLCAFGILDTFVRVRLRGIGQKWVFLRGGTLDYGDYLKVRQKYGWSPWPVYTLWITVISGISLILASFIPSKN